MTTTTLDFDAYARSAPEATYATWLRARNQERWTAMVGHRFVRDLIAGELPPAVFVRYLRYEHAFVRAAITIFGHALVKAPDAAAQTHLVGVLHALATDQDGFFADAFATLGSDPAAAPVDLPTAALGLRDGVTAIAGDGTFEDVVTAMLAAEWMYHSWCRAAAGKVAEPLAARWVALHVEDAFAAQVAWLERTINDRGPQLSAESQVHGAFVFGRVLEWEVAFHDAPYEDPVSQASA